MTKQMCFQVNIKHFMFVFYRLFVSFLIKTMLKLRAVIEGWISQLQSIVSISYKINVSLIFCKIPKLNNKSLAKSPETTWYKYIWDFDTIAEEEFGARVRAVPGASIEPMPMNNSATDRLTAKYRLRQPKYAQISYLSGLSVSPM